MKLTQKRSLGVLEEKLKGLRAIYKEKYAQMQQNLYKLKKLKRFGGKEPYLDTGTTNSTPQNSETPLSKEMKSEIDLLRDKIKQEIKRIYSSKQEFINNNKK